MRVPPDMTLDMCLVRRGLRPLAITSIALLCSCSPTTPAGPEPDAVAVLKIAVEPLLLDPPPSDRVLSGPFYETGIYSGSEVTLPLGFNGQFFQEVGSSSFVALRADCRIAGEVHLSDLALYTLPDSVNARAWMGFRFADFGNWADDIDPVRIPAYLVDGQILDPQNVVTSDSVSALSYRLRVNALFADGTSLPFFETSELICEPGGQYWPPPDIR